MPRPKKWSGETTVIRVPSHLADRLLEIAQTLDIPESESSEGVLLQNYPPTLYTIDDQRYLLPEVSLDAATAALLDAQVEALLSKCQRERINPLAVLAELVPHICKPLD